MPCTSPTGRPEAMTGRSGDGSDDPPGGNCACASAIVDPTEIMIPAAKAGPANRMGILVHTSLTVSRDYEPVEGDTTPSGGNSMPGIAVIWRANSMIQQEGTLAPNPSGPRPDPAPTMSARLRWWASAIGTVLAGFVTF